MTENQPLPPHFPWVIGRLGVTEHWSLHLPLAFKLRIEDEAMVIWRQGFTIWLTSWNNDQGKPIAVRQQHYAGVASPDRFEERQQSADGRLYYSYRLDEASDDKRVSALYAFAFADDGHLQMSFYFDDEADVKLAYHILESANSDPPSPADHRIYSQMCFATNMVMEDRQPVGYMYREVPDRPQDSGWRFFSGHETQEYVDDPSNTQVYSVALVAELNPEIIPWLLQEADVELEWHGDDFAVV